MNSFREVPMLRWSTRAIAAAAVLASVSCNLNVENPNAPDRVRALSQASGLQQLLGGALRSWVETRDNYYVMALDAMAKNYTASWNNAAMRFYSSVGSDCPVRCGWTNSSTAPEAAGGPTVAALWYGYYTVLSSANDVLSGAKNGVCFDTDCKTDSTLTVRNKAVAKMLQGMAFAGISLIYDQGFFADETTDLSNPSSLPFITRAALRDSALVKFNQAYTLAGVTTWSTEPGWMGIGQGTAYTNVQIQQLIRTMEAELIALWPRNGTENAAANWAQVATYASQGISTGTPFNWQYYIDATTRECGIDCIKNWGNSIGTERVSTRVAAMITTNHVDPWPAPNGNPCPTTGPDKRVGDGTYGPSDNFNGYGTKTATASAGTDFACSPVAIFPPARGSYHQSNLQHIRYHGLASRGEDLPTDDGTGQEPFYTTQMNDLLWAEGLIRSGGNMVQAAGLINNSRVTRGGLLALTGAEGTPALLTALQYEQEIEFMGQGIDPFMNRRRIDGNILSTPRQMPVPAKELDILQRAIYTFGGPNAPDMSAPVAGGQTRETVAQRFQALENARPGYLTRFLSTDRLF